MSAIFMSFVQLPFFSESPPSFERMIRSRSLWLPGPCRSGDSVRPEVPVASGNG